MVNHAIRLLEERHTACKVDVIVWSNKMDLLALANAKGEIILHRLTWQKLWSLPPPEEDLTVRGLAWRPDGKVIAAAYTNNEVHLIDIENKEVIHKTCYGEEEGPPITCVSWQEEKSSITATCYRSAFLDSSSTYLPKLPPISRSFGSMSEETNERFEDTKRVVDQTCLNFLFVGLTNGLLCLSAFGLFPSGTLHLPDDIKKSNGKIVSVEIMGHLKFLFVLVAVDGMLKLVTYDTIVLSVYCREIHALAYKHGLLLSLGDYLSMTMASIVEAYENMMILEIESKLKEYAEGVPEGQLSADFLEFLMFGVTSDALEMFLMQDLTDKGIKKLRHSIELSHSNIQKLILKHLQAAGQNIAYHISELRGRARLTERLQNLGIDETVMSEAFLEIGSFLVKASELQLVIDDSLNKYKAFFKWLYAILIRVSDDRIPDTSHPDISQQETNFIAEYLYGLERQSTPDKKRVYFLDNVGQYFTESNLIRPIPPSSNPWEELLEQNPCLMNDPSIIVRNENLSLYQQFCHLKRLLRAIFDTPQSPISRTFKVISVKNLSPVSPNYKVAHFHVFDDSVKLQIALIPDEETTKMTLIQVPLEGPTTSTVVFFKSEDPSVGLKTVDVHFYQQDTLSVLLEQPEEDRSAIFVQVPVKLIRESEGAPVDILSVLDPNALKPIDNLVACRMAVSGTRKVGVLLSENRNKVRMFETDVEEDEEEEEMETTKDSENTSLNQST